MSKKRNNKRQPKKYLVGSKITSYIEDPSDMLAGHDIMVAQAAYEASQDPWVQGLGIASDVMGLLGNTMYSVGNIGASQAAGKELSKKAATTAATTAAVPLKVDISEMLQNYANQFLLSPQSMVRAKTGGVLNQIPAEVEGGELLEYPDGSVFEVKGKSHEEGGVKGMFPEGTSVFSRQLGTKGKNGKFVSFADKKRNRDRKLARANKNVDDFIGRNTRKRIEEANALEEEQDLALMQEAFEAYNASLQEKEMATGGILDGEDFTYDKMLPQALVLEKYRKRPYGIPIPEINVPKPNLPKTPIPPYPPLESTMSLIPPMSPLPPLPSRPTLSNTSLKKESASKKKKSRSKTSLGKFNFGDYIDLTAGDLLGLAGNAYRAYKNREGVMREAASDTPNINYFRNYGKDALEANRESFEYLDSFRDNAEQNLLASTLAARGRSRNSATGINTLRAMDLALEQNKNMNEREIYDRYAQQFFNQLALKAQLEGDQDRMVMSGEKEKDLANRQDKSARNLAMMQSDDNIGKFITSAGDLLNKALGRRTTQGLLNSMSEYTNFDFMTGRLLGKGGTQFMENMIKDGSWETYQFPDGVAKNVEDFRKKVKKLSKGGYK